MFKQIKELEMTKDKLLERIHELHRFGKKSGLEGITALMDKLGNPQIECKFVHVAGTNGKGSVTSTLASILTCSGYKTGKFTSPYVTDFTERIQIDDVPIPYEELEKISDEVFMHVDEMAEQGKCPTEFEVVTAIGFCYFAQEKCDIVCLEVGLGGRFDATNIINPLVSVITPIGLDHMQWLGNTVSSIAFEKCGIIKEGVPVVTDPRQDTEALGVILEQLANKNTTLFTPHMTMAKNCVINTDGTSFEYSGLKIHTHLVGMHQLKNALVVLEVISLLNKMEFQICDCNIIDGFENVSLPARQEIISKRPLVILDGAHNPQGAQALEETMKTWNRKFVALVGMASDKDMVSTIEKVLPMCISTVVTTLSNSRTADTRHLGGLASKYCPNVTVENDQEKAFKLAKAQMPKKGGLVVFGSLYLAGDLRQTLLETFKYKGSKTTK